jgi:hypothetical protein
MTEIRPGDLVQCKPMIGSRAVMFELFDEQQRPHRMLVVEVVNGKLDRNVVVLLEGHRRAFPEAWLVKCSQVGLGQWRSF